ncbi:MAG: peptidylprolyl isomerase [Planctomycetota bacterium]
MIRDPLFHFLILGALLFVAYRVTRDPSAETRDEIVVTATQVEQMHARFRKTWQREPTDEEKTRLLEAYVREQVFYREALAAGLDRDDSIVRQRMQQKLEFLLDDIAGQVTPTEEQLESFLRENPDRFRRDVRTSFRHVYFKREKDAEGVLVRLRAGESVEGDRLRMLEPAYENAAQFEIARLFGAPFAERLAAQPVGPWSGPVLSGFGYHFVHVAARDGGVLPPLDEIRERVVQEWQAAERVRLREKVAAELRAKYTVRVETE